MRNRILAAIPPSEFARIARRLEPVPITLKQILYDVDTPIEYVYFLEDGVSSLVGVMSDGTAVETATVGYEGVVGLPIFHGTDRTSSQAFGQVPGNAIRMRAEDFRAEIEICPPLAKMLHRYSMALLTLIGQSAACNRLHTMEQRCARWLLHTHDRVTTDSFELTHQFLSQMLGVPRALVTEALSHLHSANCIEFDTRHIVVTDRQRLEGQTCECYDIIVREFDRLLGTDDARGRPSPLAGLKTAENGRTAVGDADPPPADRGIRARGD